MRSVKGIILIKRSYYHIMKDEGYTNEKIYEILQAKSRDNARTPMQWTSSGGFSTHTPWIEMNPRCKNINVEDALKDKDSIYYFYKKLIELRKTYKVISVGTYTPLFEESECLYAFKRNYENEELIVLNNFYAEEASVSIDNIEDYEVMISNYKDHDLKNELHIRPYETIALYKKA